MINSKIEKSINSQINEEINSAYIYLSMASYLESKGLKGFANWMNVQVLEELSHAKKLQNFLLERDGKVELEAIPKPIKDWKSVINVFKEAYNHEQYITSCINKMLKLSRVQEDYATEGMLQWFVSEQVEEEANVSEIVGKLQAIKESNDGILFLDKELSTRVFIDETKAN
jgi:ferritin